MIDGVTKYESVYRQLADVKQQRAELLEALRLGLEYWQDRQQRYSNRSPVWVQKARKAITKAEAAE